MGTIAKGEITLSPVNDAYTVLLTPSSCSISADFDGSNPNLTNAKGTITVKRGTKIVPFKVRQVVYSSAGISVSWSFQEVTTLPFAITKLANTILDGYVKFQITTQDGFNYTTEVQFSFNVVRESTMLDWIQDWEGSKTKVGGTYIMTPKLFVGKKEAVLDTSGTQPTWKEGALTGVYIGPDLLASGESSNGIYGYLKSQEIFHLNGDGGMIGGWSIDSYGISSKEGRLQILSNGVIRAINAEGDAIWSIGENGDASFAMENVRFYANGDAEFKGKITSQEGSIGGWTIEEGRIYNIPIGISAARKYIAIANVSKLEPDSEWGDDHWGWMRGYGGAALYYSSSNVFGFVAYGTGGDNLVFSAGSTNCIAGWNFDTEAIWSGDKNNTVKGYATNGITIGSNGLRGIKWYIDANGDVSFMGGKITFSAADNGGEIVGWKLNESRLSTDKITLVSDDANTGLYMSAAANSQFNSRSAASLENFIDSYGGIYLKVKADSADLAAYDLNGKRIFKIKSNGVSHIAGWNFDNATLYTGTAATSGYTNTGEITLGPTGLRGYKWRFENDGSGALAGGKINWDTEGNINVDAKISANNITSGTISTASIECQNKWSLNQNGSGYLAGQNIKWNESGDLSINGTITAIAGKIGYFNINNQGLYYGDIDSWKSTDYINLAALYPGSILLQQSYTYANSPIATVKVGLGGNADPTISNSYTYCPSAGYFYRKMNPDVGDFYLPAVKIISDNVVNRDVALYTKGAIVCHGGLLSVGHFNDANKVTVLDFSFGTTMLIANSEYRYVYLPKLSVMKQILNTTTSFIVPICLVAQYNNSKNIVVTFQDGESTLHFRNYNGGQHGTNIEMGAGDILQFLLIWDGANYYAQITDRNT